MEVIAAGTGELCQRIVAEAANPQGDVLWGGGADTLAAYNDYFQPYVCANDEFIGDAYKDADGYWIGESPLPMVFIYNKTMLDEARRPHHLGRPVQREPEGQDRLLLSLQVRLRLHPALHHAVQPAHHRGRLGSGW